MPLTLYRFGHLVQAPTPSAFDVTRDAYLLAGSDGAIIGVGPWSERPPEGVAEKTEDFSAFVATPAFADPHVHLPQFDVRGRERPDLLEWLRDVVFPEEERLGADPRASRATSRRFYRALQHFGTLAAGAFVPHSEESARVAFEEARATPLRLALGKTLMDRNVPSALKDASAEKGVDVAARLASEFDGAEHGRIRAAVAPRFVPACTHEMLRKAGDLATRRDLTVLTHLSESPREVSWVRKLEPATDYLGVYEATGLAGPRTVFAHGVHLSADEWTRLAGSGAWLAHCPCSNEALASGRLPIERAPAGVNLALASDVGASPSLSLLDAMALARALHPSDAATPARLLHLATTAGAAALGFGRESGLLTAGRDASFLLWSAPEGVFRASAWLDALLASARAGGPESVRPEGVVCRGERVA